MPYYPGPHASPEIYSEVRDYIANDLVGKGAYGKVYVATHIPSGQRIAIKRTLAFKSTTDCLRTLREIRLLRHFAHDNIIRLFSVPELLSCDRSTKVYLVQELMHTDLHKTIASNTLTDAHCQYFIYQVLRGLKYIHSAGVIHRDLKPANLLVNQNCDLKICDFGLARVDANIYNNDNSMTEYVATRWYRAPEIMITFRQYTSAIDLWSTGCILAEMILRSPLFPGRNYHHQLDLIFIVLGSPNVEDYRAIESRRARQYIRSMPPRMKTPWNNICPSATGNALDLLERFLTFSPGKRITVEAALSHPYVADYSDPEDEPICERIAEEVFSFERYQEPLGETNMWGLLFNEIKQNGRLPVGRSGQNVGPYQQFPSAPGGRTTHSAGSQIM